MGEEATVLCAAIQRWVKTDLGMNGINLQFQGSERFLIPGFSTLQFQDNPAAGLSWPVVK